MSLKLSARASVIPTCPSDALAYDVPGWRLRRQTRDPLLVRRTFGAA
jgi:hypothetical protein